MSNFAHARRAGALAALCALAAAQEPAPPAPPVSDPPPAQQVEPLAPGAIPADASAQARASWSELCAAIGAPEQSAPVTAFDLSFEARVWQSEGEKSFRDGRLRFLAPGFVDSALEKGRRRLRGPAGDWMVDQKLGSVRLQGKDLEQDRRELDQIVHVARTFANLVNARSLRLRSLELIEAPPFALPQSMLERARDKRWLTVVSPDFAIARHDGSSSARDVRAWIALDPATRLPSLAVVAEDDRGTLARESALLVELWNWAPVDGLQAPKNVRTFPPDAASATLRFQERQNLQLWLTKAALRPRLAPSDFTPPKK